MSEPPSSSVLLQRSRSGDVQAWQQLLDRYSRRLIAVCRARVGSALTSRHDAEDAAQSALGSFLRGLNAGIITIDTSSRLWHLLVKIAVRKAAEYARKVRNDPAGAPSPDGDLALAEAFSRDPGPEEAAVFHDLVGRLLQDLPERHGTILRLLLENVPVAEVASRVGASRHTVYRVRRLFQERARRCGLGEDPPENILLAAGFHTNPKRKREP